MVSANQVPLCFAGYDALDIRRGVRAPGLTGAPSHLFVLATSLSWVSSLVSVFHAAAIAGCRYVPPRVMIAQATRAVRFAAATVTTRAGRRWSIAGMRGSTEAGAALARLMSEVMPTTSSRRR